MNISRRGFLKAVGGASLIYGIQFLPGCGGESSQKVHRDLINVDRTDTSKIDFSNWVLFNKDGTVTAYSNRTELGQGFYTVLMGVVSQALDWPIEKTEVVLGDTDLCPDDGPTSGSSATINVAWPFWRACLKIAEDLRRIGALELKIPINRAEYKSGKVFDKENPDHSINIFDLEIAEAQIFKIKAHNDPENKKEYVDLKLDNQKGVDIVTGKLKYVADLKFENLQYGAFVAPPYHRFLTKFEEASFGKAKKMPGILTAGTKARQPGAVGNSYLNVRRALDTIETKWKELERPKEYDPVMEIRRDRQLELTVKDVGDVVTAQKQAKKVFRETYVTHPMIHAPMETDCALADVQEDKVVVYVSSQYPFEQKRKVAQRLKIDESKVHIIAMQCGGGYGAKIQNPVARDAANLSQLAKGPVLYLYSREDQFIKVGRGKDICVIDLETGVNANGKMISSRIDIHQDEGKGTERVYNIPNMLVQLYESEVPLYHSAVRGTSYMQGNFAMESHVDEIACRLKQDPLEFRLKHAALPAYKDLLMSTAEMIGYGQATSPNVGIGMALGCHGSEELGAVMAKVHVNRRTGEITVLHICGTYDVGKVMNERSIIANTRGAIIWGLGYGMFEKLEMDGHRIHTRSLYDYHVPRFSDIPQIDVKHVTVHKHYGGPRGIGEMPCIGVTPAIGNAVRNAIGLRLRQTPFFPDYVRSTLMHRERES